MYKGGAQYVTAELANEFARIGIAVNVIVSGMESTIREENQNLEPFFLVPEVEKIELKNKKAFLNIPSIASFLLKKKPDVIIPMSKNYGYATGIVFAILNPTAKLVPVEHSGGIGMSLGKGSETSNVHRFYNGFAKWCLSRTVSGYIAVSKGVRNAMIEHLGVPAEKIHVIYNPVIGSSFLAKRDQLGSHPWLRSKSTPVIVAAGSHSQIKGFDNLIRAFSQLNESIDCRLVIFGEGPETGSLTILANQLGVANSVSFPGFTKNLPAEIKSADVFVVSSHAESFSNVIVEALATGTPVVSTNCPSGPAEILKQGRYGTLVKTNSVNALAQGIKEAITNPSEGKSAKESWVPYKTSNIARAYLDVIDVL